MKTIVINAGPKRKDINAKLAQSALKGAESVGADVKYIDLYKLDLHGCMTCLICKREGMEGKCYWRDDVSPLIEEILDSDCLLIAAPIFFSAPTSHYQALIERLIYCLVSYQTGNCFDGRVNVGLFYTINYPKKYFEDSVRPHLKQSEDILKMLNGRVEIHSFENISQRNYSDTSEKGLEILKSKEEQFVLDLDEAFEIGADLSQ
jgi:multimeric flavodoxin WrbA